jgi:class 3 adenylate cyclase
MPALAERIPELGMAVRSGLHTGECELRGDDIGGIAVHIGARIAALAEAGEVLVSSTVKDLVNGSGITFNDRGTRVFKGVLGQWKLFAPSGRQDLTENPLLPADWAQAAAEGLLRPGSGDDELLACRSQESSVPLLIWGRGRTPTTSTG